MTSFKRFFAGAAYFFRGLGMLLTGRLPLRWAVAPVLLSLFVFLIVMVAAVWTAVHLSSQAADDAWSRTLWGSLGGFVVFALVLLIGFFTFGMLAAVVAAPFNELISQATERVLTGHTGEIKDRSFAADMLRATLAAVKLFLMEMVVVIPALLLLLIPVAGPVLFALPAGFFLALAYVDYPLDRRKLGLRQKMAYGFRHLPEIMGFGLVAYLAMLVPFVNVLMIPVAAVGATRLFLDISAKESTSYSAEAVSVPEGAEPELPAPSPSPSDPSDPSSEGNSASSTGS